MDPRMTGNVIVEKSATPGSKRVSDVPTRPAGHEKPRKTSRTFMSPTG